MVGAGGLAVDCVVRAHHRAGFSLNDGGAECRLVRVDLIVLAHVHIGKVPRRLGAAVYGVVFRGCNGEVVFRIIAFNPVT